MALSRPARITLLLVIDVVFFFVELIVGYAVGSLALVADSFHMLNDVMSLVVALYAIKLTAQTSDDKYTYGWHRAEILAALVNGVFLLALCFSISLEAIGRFFSTPEISSPKLVVVVGSLGLLSNIVGLFLFHEHGHSHPHSKSSSGRTTPEASSIPQSDPAVPVQHSLSRRRSDSFSSNFGHPAITRAAIVQAAEGMADARSPSPQRNMRHGGNRSASASRTRGETGAVERANRLSDVEDGPEPEHDHPTESSPLLGNDDSAPKVFADSPVASDDSAHAHAHSPSTGGHGHAHGSMNMHALLLHVLGDALGNVGVIATGLIIWLTDWRYRFLFDPVISLVISVIILSSAMPLVRSASFILLQGVPTTISLDAVRESLRKIPGVLNVHELHVWQLSETKIIASVHVTASWDSQFMTLAAQIREEMHHHGIHSCTIQPEYADKRIPEERVRLASDACLILCPPDQMCSPSENACCPPPTTSV